MKVKLTVEGDTDDAGIRKMLGILLDEPCVSVVVEEEKPTTTIKKPLKTKADEKPKNVVKKRKAGRRSRAEMVLEYEALILKIIEDGPYHANKLAEDTNSNAQTVRSRLARLEGANFIARNGDGAYVCPRPITPMEIDEWLTNRDKTNAEKTKCNLKSTRKHTKATPVDDDKYYGYSVENFQAAGVHNDHDFVDYFNSLVITYSKRGWIIIPDKIITRNLGMERGKFSLSRAAIEEATGTEILGMSVVKGGVRFSFQKR